MMNAIPGQISFTDDEIREYVHEHEAAEREAQERLLESDRREAYDSASISMSRRQAQVMEIIEDSPDGMTVSEILDELSLRLHSTHLDRNSVAPRVTELKKMNAIKAIGRRESPSGHPEAVWMKTEE